MSAFQQLLNSNGQRCHVVDDGELSGLTENFDAVVPAEPVSGVPNPRPVIPEWGRSLTGRVDKLEQDVAEIKTDVREIKEMLKQR